MIEEDNGSSLSERSAVDGLRSSMICLDTDWSAIERESAENPTYSASSDSLAYVMYTSGSTGTPKGVGVTHRNVTRLVKAQNYADLTEKEVFLQFAPLSFDASTFEIWGSLLNGARLVVAPSHALSPEELAKLIKTSRITTLWLTSALFHQMIANQVENLGGVKQLLAGGDVLSASHVKRVLEEIPGCRMINGYGPTENTTFSCCHPMTSAEGVGDCVSIGRPIANTQVYLLDSHLQAVPVGVPGELCVGGDGLARGYFNKPDLTAEKFIPNPFGPRQGERLYKTGDLARYLPDGNIEFLGRSDNQVKIRGFRIELGEIEAALNEHPKVREAVVTVRGEEGTDPSTMLGAGKRLVGYVVTREPVQIGDLRNFVKAKLPDYMIPSAFVFLDALPLTPSGKVDRRALPEPDQRRPELESAFVAPRTPTEKTIARIWAEILELEKVGVHDNFFDLGGHSLLATRIISRLREACSVEIPLRMLFECPTIAGLAERIDTLLWAGQKNRSSVGENSEERENIEL